MPTSVVKAESRRNFFIRTRDAWDEDPKHVILMAAGSGFAIGCFARIAYLIITYDATNALFALP